MDEKRTHPRFDVSLSAEVHTGQDLMIARAKNLSMGGVGLEIDSKLGPNTPVLVSLFLVDDGIEDESSGTLEIQGQMVWVNDVGSSGYEGGVRFAALGPDQVQRLQQFLARLNED